MKLVTEVVIGTGYPLALILWPSKILVFYLLLGRLGVNGSGG